MKISAKQFYENILFGIGLIMIIGMFIDFKFNQAYLKRLCEKTNEN